MNISPRFQKFQQVSSSMNDKRFVLVGKSAAAVALLILGAFALLVCLNSPVKSASFPAVQVFADLQKSDPAGILKASGVISLPKERKTDGIDQFVKFASFIPIEGKAVAEKKADQSAGEIEFDNFCRRHCKLLFVLVNVFGCFTIGVLLAYIRSYF